MAAGLRTSLKILLLGALALVMTGCAQPAPPAGWERVTLDGREYMLEVVADNETRELGLGGRTELPEDEGMLFVFPNSTKRHFVMRDCYIPIDIIFLDGNARVTATHHMPIEEPRGESESDYDYNNRLKRYSSRYDAQFVIELAGGQLELLNLEEGQQIKMDTDRLRSLVK